jgi:hypothetical protein
VTKYSTMGFAEMIEDASNAVRKKDPPSTAQAAIERLRDQGNSRDEIASALERLAARMRAEPMPPAPVQEPPPQHLSRPSPARERKLQFSPRTGEWEIPCSLSREELAATVPTDQTLRRMRFTRDRIDAEEQQKAERERLRVLRRFSLP